jgi:hypothetical protein
MFKMTPALLESHDHLPLRESFWPRVTVEGTAHSMETTRARAVKQAQTGQTLTYVGSARAPRTKCYYGPGPSFGEAFA